MPNIETRISDSLIRIAVKNPPAPFSQTGPTATMTIDVAALELELRAGMSGEVRFNDGDRAMYASDAGNYRMIPIGVVLPRDADDVLRTLQTCRRHGAPIVARGGGTGIPGQTVNVAVVLDFSKYMNRILKMNAEQQYARVEPGIVLDEFTEGGGAYAADIRSRSGYAQQKHARWNDRQQFVWDSFRHGRRNRR